MFPIFKWAFGLLLIGVYSIILLRISLPKNLMKFVLKKLTKPLTKTSIVSNRFENCLKKFFKKTDSDKKMINLILFFLPFLQLIILMIFIELIPHDLKNIYQAKFLIILISTMLFLIPIEYGVIVIRILFKSILSMKRKEKNWHLKSLLSVLLALVVIHMIVFPFLYQTSAGLVDIFYSSFPSYKINFLTLTDYVYYTFSVSFSIPEYDRIQKTAEIFNYSSFFRAITIAQIITKYLFDVGILGVFVSQTMNYIIKD